MSKGPGHIERGITGVLDAKPNDAFTTEELCRVVYPHAKRIERKHRVAVLRAVGRLYQTRETLDYWTSEGLGGTRIWFNQTSVQSYAMARLKGSEHYASNDGRLPDHWIKNEAQLRAMLKRDKEAKPGGAWWKHVQSNIAELAARRDKDDAKLIKVLTERWEFNCGIHRTLQMDLPPQPPELVRLLRKHKPSTRKKRQAKTVPPRDPFRALWKAEGRLLRDYDAGMADTSSEVWEWRRAHGRAEVAEQEEAWLRDNPGRPLPEHRCEWPEVLYADYSAWCAKHGRQVI